ncbi:MAG: mandelate racemase/muconate lactonizing enzyme family protein [Betaproteobacteria bacterium]|nr:mandelate racemase/muconate lactonizing enzyme family protein [Betaproteobacteria bacterium]
MKITTIETLRLPERPNLLLVQVHTDEGLTGLGETSRGPGPVEAQIHDIVAPALLGEDPLAIQKHNRALLSTYLGFSASSTEVRAASAIDIALWDILGQATGQPIHQLLGGRSRERIRVYNTCAGYHYNTTTVARRQMAVGDAAAKPEGPYDDQIAFTHRADELALSLLEEGYTAMKIWPFDPLAADRGGSLLTARDIDLALEPFRRIRHAVGNRIEIMAEFHSLWNLQQAKQIAAALEPYAPFWSEDPIRMCDVSTLQEYARSTSIPVCASETLGGLHPFRDVLEGQAADVVMLDVGWCGGLTEARKIAALAEAWQRPVAPHDCNGPVVWVASIHLMAHIPNALVMEVVRAYTSTWYRDLLTDLPEVRDGYVHTLDGPGLGTRLQPDLATRPGVTVRRSPA